ncbi:MAG: hypothetical protein JO216_08540 [Hyphomicrobiales bacterium]|nr:hypothetical protein [Hyphomicrobiales bacterium]MBV8429165.1 hypothetical protein [Hyphomicrobiales bacterium]MBW0003522.1 hypothetical protein [Hyphomicrobiales bacterium]
MTYFFALAFSRTEKGEARADAAIRALNEQHAISLASHLEGDGRGAVALAKAGELPVPMGEGVEILARFGDVPDDALLIPSVMDALASTSSPLARGAARASVTPHRHAGAARWLRGFAFRQARTPVPVIATAHRRSLVMTSLVALTLSLSGGAMLIITAKAGQRESRLMEMARPACTHTAITNEELRRLVRNEYYTGTDKQNTLRSVVALCQANPRML